MPSGATGGDRLAIQYSAARFCEDGIDPIPGITGDTGGTFSSTTGLVFISNSTGQVDLDASTPGTYVVTYTAPSSDTATTSISIDSIPVVSAGADVAICTGNSTVLTASGATTYSWSTGQTGASITVDPTTNTTYTVTGFNGACSATDSVDVTVNPQDSAAFSYAASSYCANGTDPTPTITGTAGGAFTSTAGLSINASTGEIDLDASTVGTYSITYTTTGVCPDNQSVNITINAADNAGFSYSASSYEPTDADPTPTITGLTGGTFSGTTGLVINSTTGEIDLSASTVATHTITYDTTSSGSSVCPNTSTQTVEIAVAGIANNYSMNFDSASSDYIDVGNPTELQLTGAFSVSFWMKTIITGSRAFVSKDSNTSNPRGFSVEMSNGATGGYFVVYNGTTAYGVYVSSSDANYVNIRDNNWHHITAVYTPSTSVALFIDGNFVKSNTTNIPASVNFVNNNLNIGRRPQSGGVNYYEGKLDEVGIWNTALTSTQIQSIYDAKGTNLTKDLTTVSGSNLIYWNRMGD